MGKHAHHYRLRLEHLAPATPRQPTHPPLELEFTNHDDIFQSISRLNERQLFTEPGQATEFAIGLKLFSEVLLTHPAHPLFATLGPAFGEFMQQLKGGPPAARPAPTSAPGH